jgi:hypothetical protein
MLRITSAPAVYAVLFFSTALGAWAQDHHAITGYNRLVTRLNGYPPAGESVTIGQAEGSSPEGGYLPDITNSCFAGIQFEVIDGPSVVSTHATDVGGALYGNPFSFLPAVRKVKLFHASRENGWLISAHGLNWLAPEGPTDLGVDVLSNSWVMNTDNQSISTQLLRRLDWMADKYDTIVVAALPNDPLAPIPALACSMYNGMAVGSWSGLGGYGPTEFREVYGITEGRCKPDLVGPISVNSGNTPLVSSAAALLIDEARLRIAAGQSGFTRATKAAVIKSVLLTGATKLPGWTRGNPTTTADDENSPLDWKQGAGLLDINHSELIFSTGEQPPGWVYWMGWTYGEALAPATDQLYVFHLDETEAKHFAATLTWHRKIRSTGFPNTVDIAELPQIELEVYSFVDGTFTLLQASRSPIDNVQHVALPSIDNGYVVMRVHNVGTLASDFAFSWACLPAGDE